MLLYPPVRVASLVCALIASLAPARALANGRFPTASQLVLAPDDPAHLALRTTFGLFQSTDGGAHLRWSCESFAGYGGAQDPALLLLAGGGALVGASGGLALTVDGGCSYTRPSPLDGRRVTDLTLDRADPSRALVLVVEPVTPGSYLVEVWSGHDDTWSRVGDPLPPSLFAQTLDAAPSRPSRLYVSGASKQPAGYTGLVLASDDGGLHWASHEVPLLPGEVSVFLAAVDPADPDLVYLRTYGDGGDRLLVTHDGAQSFSEKAHLRGSMLGFALAPPGDHLALGGPSDGILMALKGGESATPLAPRPVTCLTWGPDSLYSCGDGVADRSLLARSTDGGATWSPVLGTKEELTGPAPDCGASYHAACDAVWPPWVPAGAGGAGGAGGDGGGGTAGGGAAGGGGSGGGAADEGGSSGGCAVGRGGGEGVGGWLVVGWLMARRRRGRRCAVARCGQGFDQERPRRGAA